MKYFAVYLDDKINGFIVEEVQKEFLLECNSLYEFYEFEWEFETPPMPNDLNLEDGKIIILKQKKIKDENHA